MIVFLLDRNLQLERAQDRLVVAGRGDRHVIRAGVDLRDGLAGVGDAFEQQRPAGVHVDQSGRGGVADGDPREVSGQFGVVVGERRDDRDPVR